MNLRRLQLDGAEGDVQDVRTDESGSDCPHGLVRDGDLAHFFLGHPSQAPGELHRAHAVGSRVSESRFRPGFLTVVHKSSSAESTENGISPEYRLAAIYATIRMAHVSCIAEWWSATCCRVRPRTPPWSLRRTALA